MQKARERKHAQHLKVNKTAGGYIRYETPQKLSFHTCFINHGQLTPFTMFSPPQTTRSFVQTRGRGKKAVSDWICIIALTWRLLEGECRSEIDTIARWSKINWQWQSSCRSYPERRLVSDAAECGGSCVTGAVLWQPVLQSVLTMDVIGHGSALNWFKALLLASYVK